VAEVGDIKADLVGYDSGLPARFDAAQTSLGEGGTPSVHVEIQFAGAETAALICFVCHALVSRR
jgi:hypothetical protein